MQQPLAVAIIAGMLVQVPLVLLVMPAIYAVLRKSKSPPPGSAEPLRVTDR